MLGSKSGDDKRSCEKNQSRRERKSLPEIDTTNKGEERSVASCVGGLKSGGLPRKRKTSKE